MKRTIFLVVIPVLLFFSSAVHGQDVPEAYQPMFYYLQVDRASQDLGQLLYNARIAYKAGQDLSPYEEAFLKGTTYYRDQLTKITLVIDDMGVRQKAIQLVDAYEQFSQTERGLGNAIETLDLLSLVGAGENGDYGDDPVEKFLRISDEYQASITAFYDTYKVDVLSTCWTFYVIVDAMGSHFESLKGKKGMFDTWEMKEIPMGCLSGTISSYATADECRLTYSRETSRDKAMRLFNKMKSNLSQCLPDQVFLEEKEGQFIIRDEANTQDADTGNSITLVVQEYGSGQFSVEWVFLIHRKK